MLMQGKETLILMSLCIWLVSRSASEYEQFCVCRRSESAGHQKWKPPDGEVLKVNIDGSFIPALSSGRLGMVVRDANGMVLGSAAGLIDGARDALQTEAIACVKALNFARDWGIPQVKVETDSLTLPQAINGDESRLEFCSRK